MILNGNEVAQHYDRNLIERVCNLGYSPHLALIYVGSDPIIDSYIRIKQRVAEEIGVTLTVQRLSQHSTTADVQNQVRISSEQSEGVIVQLPLPSHIDRADVVNMIPLEQDCDLLSDHAFNFFKEGNSPLIPPVPGAIQMLFDAYSIEHRDEPVVVLGKGRLVGSAVVAWLQHHNYSQIYQYDEHDRDLSVIESAHLIISGTGDQWSLTPDMVKEGSILIDAGTTVEQGVSKGDIHPDCAEKASFFSPVPGGIGPLTVRMLFGNLICLSERVRGLTPEPPLE